MYAVIEKGLFTVENVTREYAIIMCTKEKEDPKCLVDRGETRLFFKSSGTSNRTLEEYTLMGPPPSTMPRYSEKMSAKSRAEESRENVGPFADIWFPFYGIDTQVGREGEELDWIVKGSYFKTYRNYGKSIIQLDYIKNAQFRTMLDSYFFCYADVCISAFFGGGLWERDEDFIKIRRKLMGSIRMIDGDDKVDLTSMNRHELNHHFKDMKAVLKKDAEKKIEVLNDEHGLRMAKSSDFIHRQTLLYDRMDEDAERERIRQETRRYRQNRENMLHEMIRVNKKVAMGKRRKTSKKTKKRALRKRRRMTRRK